MSDRLSLLAAIAAAPDDDLPRLVYADWLDESGTAHDRIRAEFLRAEVRSRTEPEPEARTIAETAATRILKKNRSKWEGPTAPRRSEVDQERYVRSGEEARADFLFRRGYVAEVILREAYDDWLSHVRSVFGDNPIRSLAMEQLNPDASRELVHAMWDWPGLATLHTLRLHSNLDPDVASLLGRNPHLRNVRDIDFGSFGTAESLRELADTPLVTQLESAGFELGGWRVIASEMLERAGTLAHLLSRAESARLRMGWLSDEAAGRFFREFQGPRLTDLDLSDRGLRDPFFADFSAAPILPQVQSLNFRVNFFSSATLETFFRQADLRSLRRLQVSDAISYRKEESRNVWHAIRNADFASQLVQLDFGCRYGISARDLEPLETGAFPQLEELALAPAAIGDVGVTHITHAAFANRLRDLVLWDCGVTDHGARLLADARFPAIQRLSVRQNPLTSAGIRRLTEAYGDRVAHD